MSLKVDDREWAAVSFVSTLCCFDLVDISNVELTETRFELYFETVLNLYRNLEMRKGKLRIFLS